MVKQPLTTLWHMPRNLTISIIGIYQMTLSPDHGPLKQLHPYGFCRHEPTCSVYAVTMFRKRGFVMGSMLTIQRIVRCNPWKTPDDNKIRSTMGKL